MLTWIALPAALAGFGIGWVSARLSDWVQAPEEAVPIRGRRPLLRDPLVQVGLAVVWAGIPFFISGDLPRWAMAGLLSVPLVQVAVTDLRTRYVYTVVAGVGIVLGLAFGWQFHQVDWWWAVVGAVGGALIFAALYGVGRLIYRGGEPMARGDITIAAMVGASAANCWLTALVYGVLFGGVLALGVLLIARSRHVYMPYGPGLCLGGLATLFVC